LKLRSARALREAVAAAVAEIDKKGDD